MVTKNDVSGAWGEPANGYRDGAADRLLSTHFGRPGRRCRSNVSTKAGAIQGKLATMTNLHSALKTTVVSSHNGDGIHYILVRLQNGKDDFIDTLHARPNAFSWSGFQTTDFLSLLGFSRSGCAFHQSECFCRQVPEGLDIKGLSADIGKSFQTFLNAVSHLENCGLFIEQPDGSEFFYGKPATRRAHPNLYCRGDGHTSPKTEKMKQSEDGVFHFVFTWIAELLISMLKT